MAHKELKKVSIIEDIRTDISTSRKVQWAIVGWTFKLLVLGGVLVIAWVLIENHKTEVQTKHAQAQQELAARPVPRILSFEQADQLHFFDAKSGAPVVWYVKTASGYLLYDAEGYNTDGIKLNPVTQNDVVDIKRWADQIVQAKQEKIQQDAIATLKALFRFSDIPQGTKVFVLGVDTRDLSESLRDECVWQLRERVSSQSSSELVKTDVLTDEFYSNGYFNKACNGDSAFLDQASVFEHAGHLLLIKPSATFKSTSSVQGMTSCRVIISCLLYTGGTKQTKRTVFEAVGPGFSNEASFKQAMQTLLQTNKDKISLLLENQ